MIITVVFLLALAAFILTLVSAYGTYGRCPLWIPTLLLGIALLLQHIPLR